MSDSSTETGTTETSRPDATPTRSRRRWFRLAAVGIALLPFVLLELGFRLFGIGEPGRFDDPLVGFSGHSPLFEPVANADVYRTARSRQLFFGVQEFAESKPASGFRVFCLGGSTVRGRPYEPDSAFPEWLRVEMAAADPKREYEILNCGGLSYASYRLRVILTEVLEYQPDLIVVATGHNEFLEDRTYGAIKNRSEARAWLEDRANSLRLVTATRQLLGFGGENDSRTTLDKEVEAKLDQASGYGSYHRDDEWRAGVIAHYEQSIRAMVEECRDAGVPLILVELGCNLRDTAPFKSEHRSGLSADEELQWQREFDSGGEADSAKLALQHYREAEAIDDQYALLSFRIARCLDQLGKPAEALEYYIRAKDDDICPLRMIEPVHGHLRTIAEETRTPLIDARGLIQKQSADQIPGHDWYMDHVHPSIVGHQVIAQAIAQVMREQGWPADVDRLSRSQRRDAYRAHFVHLGPNWLVSGRERVGWLEKWARRSRLYDETLPADARGYLHRGFRSYAFNDDHQAWADFLLAASSDPTTMAELLPFALQLHEQGRSEDCQRFLDRLNRERPGKILSAEIAVAQILVAADCGHDEFVDALLPVAAESINRGIPELAPWFEAMPEAAARVKELLKRETR